MCGTMIDGTLHCLPWGNTQNHCYGINDYEHVRAELLSLLVIAVFCRSGSVRMMLHRGSRDARERS